MCASTHTRIFAYIRVRVYVLYVLYAEKNGGENLQNEKAVEKKLRDGVRGLGGRAYKFVSPGNAGVPDRLVVLPGGRILFVELKDEVGKVSPRQKVQIAKLTALGCDVRVISGMTEAESFLRDCRKETG